MHKGTARGAARGGGPGGGRENGKKIRATFQDSKKNSRDL